MPNVETPILTARFECALVHANRLHALQVRKGGLDQPYVSHLFAVCATVLDYGGDED